MKSFFEEELKQAVFTRDIALATYNLCDPNWEAVYWYEYMAAEERVRALLRQARQEWREGGKSGLITEAEYA